MHTVLSTTYIQSNAEPSQSSLLKTNLLAAVLALHQNSALVCKSVNGQGVGLTLLSWFFYILASFVCLLPLSSLPFAMDYGTTYTYRYLPTKGQTKSQCVFLDNVSSKKRTNEFNLTTMRLIFVRLLEEIEDTKKTFRN